MPRSRWKASMSSDCEFDDVREIPLIHGGGDFAFTSAHDYIAVGNLSALPKVLLPFPRRMEPMPSQQACREGGM